MNWLVGLEWLAFSGAIFAAFSYGRSKMRGAIVGLTTGILFVSWGILAEVYAAAITNIAFFIVHGRNLRIALSERKEHDRV